MKPPLITIRVLGLPQPAGSKKPAAIYRGSKAAGTREFTGHVTVRDDNPKSRSWKNDVREAARAQYKGALLDCPLAVEIVFALPRPSGHFGARGNVMPSKSPTPAVIPDVLKLARAVEDALTSVLWKDDARIVVERIEKVYGEPAAVTVRVWALPSTMAEVGAHPRSAGAELPLFAEPS